MQGRNAVDAFAPIFAQAYTEWLESTKDLKSKDARQGGDQSCEENGAWLFWWAQVEIAKLVKFTKLYKYE